MPGGPINHHCTATVMQKHICLAAVMCLTSPLLVKRASITQKKISSCSASKGIKGLNIGKYYPDKLLFLNLVRQVKNKA